MSNIRKYIFHPVIFIPVLLLAFLGTAVLAKIFVWPTIKLYQAGKLKKEATVFLEQENYRNSFIQIRKAILKDPEDVESYKIALQAVENSKEHIQYVPGFLQKLMEIDPGEPDHFNKFILITLQMKEYEQAKLAFDNYPEKLRDSNDYHQIGFSLGQRLQDFDMAEFHVERLLEKSPEDPELIFSLASLRLQTSTDENKIADSKSALNALTDQPDWRTKATRALLSFSVVQNNPTDTKKHIEEMSLIENLSIQDKLLVLEARIAIDENGIDTRLRDFLTEKIESPRDLVSTLDFLIKHDLLTIATEWVDGLGEELKQHQDVKRRISQIYYNNRDWDRLKNSLLDDNWEDHEFGRLLMLAITSKTENDRINFRKYWEQCLMQVRGDRERQKLLFQTTVELDWKSESIEVLEATFQEDPTNDEVFNGLSNHLMSTGETARALEVLARRVDYVSDDHASKNNFALLSLLTGINQSRAYTYASDNYSSDNENPFFATTWAFALQKQGRKQEAVNVLSFLSEEELSDPQRAAYIAKIYYENGDREKAVEALSRVDETSLYSEELKLLKTIKQSLSESEE